MMRIDLQLFGGRGSSSGGGGGGGSKTTPNGYKYGGPNSEIDADANPKNVDKVNKWLGEHGWELDEAISQVKDTISDMESMDPGTADFLKGMLPSLKNATINKRDLKEVIYTALE